MQSRELLRREERAREVNEEENQRFQTTLDWARQRRNADGRCTPETTTAAAATAKTIPRLRPLREAAVVLGGASVRGRP